MLSRWAAYTAGCVFRFGCRVVFSAGRDLRDGMTAQRAAASGPVPVSTSGLVVA